MRIGLLTFHYIPNIGAVLQAYALCKYLRNHGFECEIIDYRCENLDKREIQLHIPNNILHQLAWKIFVKPNHVKKIKACQAFLLKENMISEYCYSNDTILNAVKNYDIIISGSDMIWDLNITGGDFTYYLNFKSNSIIKMAYAASGLETLKKSCYDKVRFLLSEYKTIGVREQKTKEILKKEMNIDSELVCDPTLLLEAEEWKELAVNNNSKNYVLVYFPYEEILNAAKIYTQKNDKELIVIENSVSPKSYRRIWPFTPEEWLGYVINADAIFTDSYHGLIFSLLFGKKVWTNNKGARQETLIKELNADGCFLQNDTQVVINDEINFANIILHIKRFRDISENFLLEAINNYCY